MALRRSRSRSGITRHLISFKFKSTAVSASLRPPTATTAHMGREERSSRTYDTALLRAHAVSVRMLFCVLSCALCNAVPRVLMCPSGEVDHR